jgi:hypothetical protein
MEWTEVSIPLCKSTELNTVFNYIFLKFSGCWLPCSKYSPLLHRALHDTHCDIYAVMMVKAHNTTWCNSLLIR